jgi:hypothetical protein
MPVPGGSVRNSYGFIFLDFSAYSAYIVLRVLIVIAGALALAGGGDGDEAAAAARQ